MSYILPLTAKEVEERLLKVTNIDTKVASLETFVVGELAENGTIIKVTVDYTVQEGTEIKFKAPVNDSEDVIGLRVAYKSIDGVDATKDFAFADAHSENVGTINNLFAKNAIVKVILALESSLAFVQNADTNSYLEKRFTEIDGVINDLRGDIPDMITVDQEYDAKSSNAISGKAVANAISTVTENVLNLTEQELTPDQKAQVKTNLGISVAEAGGVSYVIEEEGKGNDWLYKKWSSGKCELSKNLDINAESESVTLETPFLVIDGMLFVVVTEGGISSLLEAKCEEDAENKKTDVILSFTPGTAKHVSIRLEGLWQKQVN